ncbi:MAG: GFA family protein [Geminicoccaceae bacterium]
MRGDPFWICFDHDDDCRRAIGGAVTVWVSYRPAAFRVIRRTLKNFSKTKGVVRTFCSDCGTSVSYADTGLSDALYVTIGFLDRPDRFLPQAHAYWRMRLPWITFGDDLPLVDGYSRSRDPAFGDPVDRNVIARPKGNTATD